MEHDVQGRMEVHTREGRVFEIDTPTVEGDTVMYAVRVWEFNSVVNDPRAEHFSNANDAFDAGMAFIKASTKGKK